LLLEKLRSLDALHVAAAVTGNFKTFVSFDLRSFQRVLAVTQKLKSVAAPHRRGKSVFEITRPATNTPASAPKVSAGAREGEFGINAETRRTLRPAKFFESPSGWHICRKPNQ